MEFRNPDLFQVLPFRDWIRQYLPSGSQGVVVEDLDLVMRVYSPRYDTDAVGKFMLIELKFFPANIGTAQTRTFKLIHNTLRAGDSAGERYAGYYVLQYTSEDWDQSAFYVNGREISRDELIEFLQFRLPNIPEHPPGNGWNEIKHED